MDMEDIELRLAPWDIKRSIRKTCKDESVIGNPVNVELVYVLIRLSDFLETPFEQK